MLRSGSQGLIQLLLFKPVQVLNGFCSQTFNNKLPGEKFFLKPTTVIYDLFKSLLHWSKKFLYNVSTCFKSYYRQYLCPSMSELRMRFELSDPSGLWTVKKRVCLKQVLIPLGSKASTACLLQFIMGLLFMEKKNRIEALGKENYNSHTIC